MKTVILNGISAVISQIATKQDKVNELIRKIFQPFTSVESVELGFVKIRFQSQSNKTAPHLIVLEALEKLENLAQQLQIKVVLFFDEYQHVLRIEGILDFEKSLRSFAQKAKYTTLIFSGSNRHLLQAMFDDDTRPFYNMCDHILLSRIPRADFEEHIQNLSQKKWGASLTNDTINHIFESTARHSYYVNALCRRLWQRDRQPDIDIVIHEWQQLASEKRYEINRDFESFTPIQRTILIELAHEPFDKPTSKAVIQRLRSSTSGIMNALNGLLKHDHIFIDEEGNYRILNPLTEFILWQATARFYDD